MFQIPEWDLHMNAGKDEQKILKTVKDKSKRIKPMKKSTAKKEITPLLHKKSKQKLKAKKNFIKPVDVNTDTNSEATRKPVKSNVEDMPKVKSRKRPITLQTLFLKAEKRKKLKDNDFIKKSAYDFNLTKSKQKLSLREQMLQKLKSARFRYLNEQMYMNVGKDAKKYFDNDPNAYAAYHEGYRQQVAKWPVNPVDIITRKIKKLPQTFVIADFGCGEAKLAKSTPHTVHCFDLVAVDETVTACDMAHVPLEDNSVNVVVFCLSLMGTNIKDYILEANRVLKNKGQLLIAEVESRFEDVEVFIKNMRSYGFVNKTKDFSHNLFFFLDFVKKSAKTQNNLPDINLKPCLYKKR
ncbi:hypothetical protein RN001_006973 [Aquatica leii]|uniref:Ribosomal RNA-processing protein 8 n=1 Tax=Aquatica leii TaxID=1421715 RepID=A0AAN7Q2E4_9COLE|nr:hypothetical protein RN001_006973 [Aquatica leii]